MDQTRTFKRDEHDRRCRDVVLPEGHQGTTSLQLSRCAVGTLVRDVNSNLPPFFVSDALLLELVQFNQDTLCT